MELPGTDWLLVITNKGTHFFHNKKTKESHWSNSDDEVIRSLEAIEKDNLLLLIAKARGLKLDDDREEKLQNDLKPKIDEEEVVDMGQVSEDTSVLPQEEFESAEESKAPKTSGLISGYSSSEDDSDDEEDEEQEAADAAKDSNNSATKEQKPEVEVQPELPIDDAAESSEEENAFDLADLEGLSSDEEGSNSQDSELVFRQLLDESELDPYSPWEIESLKIVNDPRFSVLENNKDRKNLYDQWSTSAIQERQLLLEATQQKKEDVVEEPFVQYMKYLESKELDRLYVDFKKKHKKELKKLDLGEKERESVYKEYIIYYKKSEEEKIKIFKSFLMGAKIFKKNVQESQETSLLEEDLNQEKIDELNFEDAYRLLHNLENDLKISESLRFSTKYYILEVKKRISLILEIAKLFKL